MVLPQMLMLVLSAFLAASRHATADGAAMDAADDVDTADAFAQRFRGGQGQPPPVSFSLGGATADLSSWPHRSNSSTTPSAVVHTTVYSKAGLDVTVEATAYQATARAPAGTEWLMWFENTGSTDTPVISNVLPLDMTLSSGADKANATDQTFTVLHADGSNASHHDFQPLFSDMGPVAGCVRCATGRPDATAGPLNFSNCSRPSRATPRCSFPPSSAQTRYREACAALSTSLSRKGHSALRVRWHECQLRQRLPERPLLLRRDAVLQRHPAAQRDRGGGGRRLDGAVGREPDEAAGGHRAGGQGLDRQG
jgi:hypothetical protein